MKTLRLLLHSFILALANIACVIVGFGVYQLFRPINQIAIQAPSAAILCIIVFLLWSWSVLRLAGQNLSLQGRGEFAGTFLLALLWSPTIFIPLHYVGRGYLTSFANIWATWLFQVPTNIMTLLAVKKWVKFDKI
jgi:hypothetical protein